MTNARKPTDRTSKKQPTSGPHLKKETLLDLTVRTGVRAGGASGNDTCSGDTFVQGASVLRCRNSKSYSWEGFFC